MDSKSCHMPDPAVAKIAEAKIGALAINGKLGGVKTDATIAEKANPSMM
jgi:hypothetical protein